MGWGWMANGVRSALVEGVEDWRAGALAPHLALLSHFAIGAAVRDDPAAAGGFPR
jgi:hypothetical protein